MASPPGYGGFTSPPGPSSLALPRQRPTLALPTNIQSRKPSIASNTSSAHPLRQTSFPPPDSLEAQHALAEDNTLRQYSPSAADSLEEFSDDNDIRSAISGPTGPGDDGMVKKRKRGEKRPRGRPAKNPAFRAGSMSLANGEEGRSGAGGPSKRGGTAGAPSVVTADDADAEDDDDDDDPANGPGGAGGGRVPLYEGGQMTQAEQDAERERKRIFYETITEEQRLRLASHGRSKLRTADVRRLVNQVLGQSVPQNVVLVVQAYSKMFAGMLIEEAREVQGEWTAVEERPGGNKALEKVRKAERVKREVDEDRRADAVATNGREDGHLRTNGTNKTETTSQSQTQLLTNGTTHHEHDDDDKDEINPGGAGGLSKNVEECDRGPLLPDHLREALRRYKKRRSGGPVGFTGLSLEGRENTAPRMGGRRLFK